jgi:CRP/FNR family transcriptional regulator
MQEKSAQCAVCYARTGGLFQGLSEDLLKKLEERKSVRDYKRGQIIFSQGDPAQSLYCVHFGLVKLSKIGGLGEETVIRLLGPGQIAGYRPILADEPFAASAEALERTRICMIPRATFRFILQNSTEIAYRLLVKLARELKESEEQWLARAQETVPQRMAHLLLALAAESRGTFAGQNVPVLKLRRVDMAKVIGTTPETISRNLRLFKEKGFISLSRTALSLRNPLGLQKIAEETT